MLATPLRPAVTRVGRRSGLSRLALLHLQTATSPPALSPPVTIASPSSSASGPVLATKEAPGKSKLDGANTRPQQAPEVIIRRKTSKSRLLLQAQALQGSAVATKACSQPSYQLATEALLSKEEQELKRIRAFPVVQSSYSEGDLLFVGPSGKPSVPGRLAKGSAVLSQPWQPVAETKKPRRSHRMLEISPLPGAPRGKVGGTVHAAGPVAPERRVELLVHADSPSNPEVSRPVQQTSQRDTAAADVAEATLSQQQADGQTGATTGRRTVVARSASMRPSSSRVVALSSITREADKHGLHGYMKHAACSSSKSSPNAPASAVTLPLSCAAAAQGVTPQAGSGSHFSFSDALQWAVSQASSAMAGAGVCRPPQRQHEAPQQQQQQMQQPLQAEQHWQRMWDSLERLADKFEGGNDDLEASRELWVCIHQPAGGTARATMYYHLEPMDDDTWELLQLPPPRLAELDGGLSFAGCEHRDGSWYNYRVRIKGEFGPTEQDVMFPNSIEHEGRTMYNARGMLDLAAWLADATPDRLLQHLSAMAAYPERRYPGERCYSRLTCTWGVAALQRLGISKRSVCGMLWTLRQRSPGTSSGSNCSNHTEYAGGSSNGLLLAVA